MTPCTYGKCCFFIQSGGWKKLVSEIDEVTKRLNGSEPRPEYCSLLPERGPCMGFWFRYAFNATSGKCERFRYGGCIGNENNFHSKHSCEKTCKERPAPGNLTTSAVTDLCLDFDSGFGDWDYREWYVLPYKSSAGRLHNVTEGKNASSTAGASPQQRDGIMFHRPRLLHEITLVKHTNLTIRFSLRVMGTYNSRIHRFFQQLNPGFRIYIGDDEVFDYGASGVIDEASQYNASLCTARKAKRPIHVYLGVENLLRVHQDRRCPFISFSTQ